MKKFKILFLAISSVLTFSLSANAMEKINKQQDEKQIDTKEENLSDSKSQQDEKQIDTKEENLLNIKKQEDYNLKNIDDFENKKIEKFKNILNQLEKNINAIVEFEINEADYEYKFLTIEKTFYFLRESIITYFDIQNKEKLTDHKKLLNSLYELATLYYTTFSPILQNYDFTKIRFDILLDNTGYKKNLTQNSNIEEISKKVISNKNSDILAMFKHTQKILSELKDIKKRIFKTNQDVQNIVKIFDQIEEYLKQTKKFLTSFPNNSIEDKKKAIFYLIKAFSTKALLNLTSTANVRQKYKVKEIYENVLNTMDKLYEKIILSGAEIDKNYCLNSQVNCENPLEQEEILNYSNELKELIQKIKLIKDPYLMRQILTLWSRLLKIIKKEYDEEFNDLEKYIAKAQKELENLDEDYDETTFNIFDE